MLRIAGLVLLLLSAPLKAAEMTPERAKALIVAAWHGRFLEPVHLSYVEEFEALNDAGVRTNYRLTWKIRGPLLEADEWCLQHPRSVGLIKSRARLKITRGAEGYDVRDTSDGWTARMRPATDVSFDRRGPIQAYLRPINEVSLLELLADHPVVEGYRSSDGELVAGIAFSRDGAEAVAAGRQVWGALGWRCTFRRHDGRVRLERVESVQTARILDENRKEVPNPGVLAGETPRPWRKRIDCGIGYRFIFSEFVRIGTEDMPLRLDHTYPTYGGTVRVLPGSIRTERLQDEEFAFRPPETFGDAGIVADFRSKRVYYQGSAEHREGAVAELIRPGDAIKQRSAATAPADSPPSWVWAVGFAMAAVGLLIVVLVLRCVRARALTRR